MRDQNKSGCCRQQADTKNEEQAAATTIQGCGCGNRGQKNEECSSDQAQAAGAEPRERNDRKQGCCCC